MEGSRLQSRNPVLISFSRKNFTSPSSASLMPSAARTPRSPFCTATNTDRKCSRSEPIRRSAAPKSPNVCDSVHKKQLKLIQFSSDNYANRHKNDSVKDLDVGNRWKLKLIYGMWARYLREQWPPVRRHRAVPVSYGLWFRTNFPGNSVRDFWEALAGTGPSLPPEVVWLISRETYNNCN